MEHMKRALLLARQAIGISSPNPPVGALVVKDDRVLGEGHTLAPGEAHAEITALSQAGIAAKGATLYTTLEPCCHFGRTPPCTKSIIKSGIREVKHSIKKTITPNSEMKIKLEQAVRYGGEDKLEVLEEIYAIGLKIYSL